MALDGNDINEMICFVAETADNDARSDEALIKMPKKKKRKAMPKLTGLKMLVNSTEHEESRLRSIASFFEEPMPKDLKREMKETSKDMEGDS
jgi:hypothetical protein